MIMQRSPEKLVRDVRVVVQDAEDLIKATAGDIEEKTREARAKLAGALVVAKDSLAKTEQTASDSVRVADAWVRAYAYYCVGAAFFTGVLLGAALIARKES
jgi:ElaB/YqjD/DUF883 family membrane-anchored ribosome-binding protein